MTGLISKFHAQKKSFFNSHISFLYTQHAQADQIHEHIILFFL